MTTPRPPVGPASGARACRAAVDAGFRHDRTTAGVGVRSGELAHEYAHPDGRRLLILTTASASLISARAAQPLDRWPRPRPRGVNSVPKVIALVQST